MKKKNITTDELAVMINKGFEKTATTEQLNNQIGGLKKWAEGRFDRIEKVLIEEQNRKIEKLESRIEYLENMLNLPVNK